MSVKINSYGGPITWILRKHCSNLTSKIALSFAAACYDKQIKKYIRYFEKQEKTPIFANCMIETINRCNGSCAFCPANKSAEKRPFKKMSEEMFYSIIDQLKAMCWKGNLYLCINNEPFVDNRILKFAEHAKKELPDVFVALITNGTLLSGEKIFELVGKLDRVIINDYSSRYRLSKPHRSIYKAIKAHPDAFKDIEVIINRRFDGEILATRAGYAPNKRKKNNHVNGACIYPFMDILIYPDGMIGMCCNDCMEISDFGNVSSNNLKEIWENEKWRELRTAMRGVEVITTHTSHTENKPIACYYAACAT